MIIITHEIIRNTYNRELALVREEMGDQWDDAWCEAHATRTVIEAIEMQVVRMLDSIKAEKQELINLHMGF